MIEAASSAPDDRMDSLNTVRIGVVVPRNSEASHLVSLLETAGIPSANISLLAGKDLPATGIDLLILSEVDAALRQLKLLQSHESFQCAVVVLGDTENEGAALRLIEAGAQDFLSLERCHPELLKRTLLHAVERHHLRSQLKIANSRLQKVISLNADGLLVVTQQGAIAFANPAAAEMLGRSAEELIGSQFGAPLVDGDFADVELVRLRSDAITAELRVVDLEWDGEPAFLASLRDVTQRRKTQQRELRYQSRIKQLARQLSESEDRERRRLARILHDELQHSLLSAKMTLQLFGEGQEKGPVGPEAGKISAYLDEAIRTSRTLTSELMPTVLDDKGLVPALHWLARSHKERYGLLIRIEADDGIEVCEPDLRGFLFQAIRELLLNVVKHARGASVSVTVRNSGEGKISVIVADDGPGFDLALLDVDKRDVGGFGLFHMHERIEHFDGTLTIETSPDAGSTFTLTVPIRVPHRERTQEGKQPAESRESSSESVKVLIVDDQRSFRYLFTKMLEKTAMVEVVGAAGSGAEGLRLAEELNPDMVLCDVSLPDIEGPQLVRQLIAARPSLRVIACSMYEPEEMARPMHDAGAETYLRKDVSIDELKRAIGGSDR